MVVERAGRGIDTEQAQMMRRIHEETKYFRKELLEAKADNEQSASNLNETIAELREEPKR